MDYQDEQQQEIEVLRSIYPDELNVLSDNHFTLYTRLDTASDKPHALLLDVRYPACYPEETPKLDLEVVDTEDEVQVGLDDEEDDAKYVSLAESIGFDKPDLASLLRKLNDEAAVNAGMPSVFSLASMLKEEAELLFQTKLDAAQKAYDDELLAKEQEEQQKFHGTKVTPESFKAWRKAFREEMQIDQKDKERFAKMHNGKMTGREIFESGLAGDVDDDMVELQEAASKLEME